MKFLLLLALASVAVATPNRITNGSPASVGQFPWQVAIYSESKDGVQFCGGSLISNQWVLTAAHCTKGAFSFRIHLGGVTLNSLEIGQIKVDANEFFAHPKYSIPFKKHDIALIKLPKTVEVNDRIQPIKLPKRGNKIGSDELVTVSGWGQTSDGSNSISYDLNFVELTTITKWECMLEYGILSIFNIIDSTLCCKGVQNKSICGGDSGGPVVTIDSNGEATLIAVVSFGHSDGCESGKPSGHVRTESYLDWINEVTGMPV